MAQRLIVILQRQQTPEGRPIFGYVLRADVPVARQSFLANPTYKSPFAPAAGDTDPDAASLTNGSVVEKAGAVTVDATLTQAEIQVLLQRLQAQFQGDVTNDRTYIRYGSFYNGTSWTLQGA